MEKNEIFFKSLQIILFKRKDSDNDNKEAVYCEDDGEHRVFCNICDNLCMERFRETHLKSQTYTNTTRKKQQLNN